MSTKFISRFFRKFRETGGAFNYPAKVKDNPQGGIIALPYFGDHVKALGPAAKIGEAKEKAAGWGLGGPSLVAPNPQGGILMFPLLGPGFKHISEKGKKPEKPKAPKALRPKGSPTHKKLHSNPHPILAECCDRLTGKTLKREADSSSMYPAMTAANQKKKESALKFSSARFRESAVEFDSDNLPTKFHVVLIEEGMGNSTDAFYYTKDALESAVEVFSGLKIMVDHPTAREEDERPERSTRDVIGHYENLYVDMGPEGQAQLCADIDILDVPDTELARAQMVRATENAKKFPGRDFIGLSINASGPSQETPIADVINVAPQGAKQKLVDAQGEGIETVRVVTKINRAVSCDLVTEAGAGGKILNIIGETDGQNA